MIKALGLALLLALTPPSLALAQQTPDAQGATIFNMRQIAPGSGGTVSVSAWGYQE